MISTSTRLPLWLLQLDLLMTCLLGKYIQAFLTWRIVWYRQVASSLLSRWSLPLDHLCLRRNSRISWWNSAFTINHIFFASSHSKYLLSLAWSQHCSNMSCTSKRVSNQGTGTEQPGAREAKDSTRGPAAWPTRDRHLPRWLAGQNWAR